MPYVPTPANVVDAMLDLARIQPADVLVDLGSGDGRIVIAAAKRFGISATGVEINPELVRQAEEAARREGVADKVRFIPSDLFGYDLRAATVVTMFLTPGVNLRLRPKLLRELKPGTRVVSHRFDMGSWAPLKTVRVDDDPVYLWIVPDKPLTLAVACKRPADNAASVSKLAALFAYDATLPLDAHEEKTDAADVVSVSYAGVHGPVSATLVVPARPAKYPAVIFAADYGKRDEFLPEALALARGAAPAVSLLIDSPVERPVGWRRSFNSLAGDENDRDIHIQAVIDIRRGIDLLAARRDVDSDRIAYIGHGYGANWGVILASIEPRLCRFALAAAYPIVEQMQSDDPDWANARYAMGSQRFASYAASMSAIDPIRFGPFWAGSPILFQFGRLDSFVTRAMADCLVNSLPRPQKAIFYDAGHSVNDPRAAADRSAFLRQCFAAKPAHGSGRLR